MASVLFFWMVLLQNSSPEWNAELTNRHVKNFKTTTPLQNIDVTSMDNDKIHIVFSTGCNAFQDCTSL
jgi:hypothetical protein